MLRRRGPRASLAERPWCHLVRVSATAREIAAVTDASLRAAPSAVLRLLPRLAAAASRAAACATPRSRARRAGGGRGRRVRCLESHSVRLSVLVPSPFGGPALLCHHPPVRQAALGHVAAPRTLCAARVPLTLTRISEARLSSRLLRVRGPTAPQGRGCVAVRQGPGGGVDARRVC